MGVCTKGIGLLGWADKNLGSRPGGAVTYSGTLTLTKSAAPHPPPQENAQVASQVPCTLLPHRLGSRSSSIGSVGAAER